MSDLPYANVVGYSVTLAVYLLMASIAIPIYLMRRHQPVIQNRSIILSMISAFMGVIHFIALYVNEMDRTFVSCPFIIITSTFLPPLWGLSYLLRSTILIFKGNWTKEKLQFKSKTAGWYGRNQKFFSKRSLALFFGLAVVIHGFATGVSQIGKGTYGENFHSCISKELIAFSVFGALYLILLLIVIIKIWRVQDVYKIKTELTIVLIIVLPLYCIWISCYLIDTVLNPAWFMMAVIFLTFIASICWPIYLTTQPQYQLQPFVQQYAYLHANPKKESIDSTTLEIPIQDTYDDKELPMERVPQKRKTSAQFFQDTPLIDSLAFYLIDPDYYKSFEEFCVQAWCVEQLIFYETIRKFVLLDGEEMKTEAKRIIGTHIKVESDLELESLHDRVREKIFQDEKDGDVSIYIFDEAFLQIYTEMCIHLFPIWKKSPEFVKIYATKV